MSLKHLLLVLLAFPLVGFAERTSFPDDAGLINVKTLYGAVGDGVTDDTAAIQKAITENVNKNPARTIYFPVGTYLVSATLDCVTDKGIIAHRMSFQGEDNATTILKLKDNCPGFEAPDPKLGGKPVLRLRNLPGPANNGVFNNVYNLSIDTGKGNPGANGLNWAVCNIGTLRDVVVRSGDPGRVGFTGIECDGWPGPALMVNVTVEGFNTGINVRSDRHSVTFDDIKLRGQLKVGFSNGANGAYIRRLVSENTVPALEMGGIAASMSDAQKYPGANNLTVLIDSKLTGGAESARGAMVILPRSQLFARNVETAGYPSAVFQVGDGTGTAIVPVGMVEEFSSSPPLELFATAPKSLNLPIEVAPEFHDNDFKNWANVLDYLPKDGTLPSVNDRPGKPIAPDRKVPDNEIDYTKAIQAAIDSGKSTIYFPPRIYQITDTVIVRGNVKRLLGLNSYIYPRNPAFDLPGQLKTMFKIESTTGDFVIVDRLMIWPDVRGAAAIHNTSPKTLVLRDGVHFHYHNDLGAGKLFVDNTGGMDFWTFKKQKVWVRQGNAENMEGVKLVNDGGDLWMLGFKTEMATTAIRANKGSRTEVLGAYIFCNSGSWRTPIFDIHDADFSASFQQFYYWPNLDHALYVSQRQNGLHRELNRWEAAGSVPLFVARASSDSSASGRPVVDLKSPADGAAFDEPAKIELAAESSLGVPRFKALSGFKDLGTPPEVLGEGPSKEWANVPAGQYFVYATAEGASDYAGKPVVGISNQVTIDVRPDLKKSGRILREYWEHIAMAPHLSLLEESGKLATRAEMWDLPTTFESPRSGKGNDRRYYGVRMRGFIQPPVTGDYVFSIAGDNSAALRLSTDDNPLNAKLVCRLMMPSKTPDAFDADPERTSLPIKLEAGKRYYIESVSRGGHHRVGFLKVGWKGPGMDATEVIDGKYLFPADPTQLVPTAKPVANQTVLSAVDSTFARGGGAITRLFKEVLTLDVQGQVIGPEAWMKFDLASLKGKTIRKATLVVTPVSLTGSVGGCYFQGVPSDDWSMNTLSFSGRPTSEDKGTAFVPEIMVPTALDVTAFVTEQAGADGLASFRIYAKEQGGTLQFASSRAAKEITPKLIIETAP